MNMLSEAMRLLLDFYLQFSHPLAALALLSLSVFLVMLPLYHLGDKLLLREKQRKGLMQHELDSIAQLEGQRKYFYTRAIYKRYGYSPFYSLIGLFGLAVQLPFFFAAYRMLHDYSAFGSIACRAFCEPLRSRRPDSVFGTYNQPAATAHDAAQSALCLLLRTKP